MTERTGVLEYLEDYLRNQYQAEYPESAGDAFKLANMISQALDADMPDISLERFLDAILKSKKSETIEIADDYKELVKTREPDRSGTSYSLKELMAPTESKGEPLRIVNALSHAFIRSYSELLSFTREDLRQGKHKRVKGLGIKSWKYVQTLQFRAEIIIQNLDKPDFGQKLSCTSLDLSITDD